MSEIEQVNQLINDLGLNKVIPPLLSSGFSIVKKTPVTFKEIKDLASEGWFLYSDKFVRGHLSIDKSNILEAEWYHSQSEQSSKVQLLGEKKYKLTTTQITSDKKAEFTWVFQEINIFAAEQGKDQYRICWQSNDNGKYIAIAQQFIGYQSDTSKESK